MLTVQPSKIAFESRHNRRLTREEAQVLREEREYQKNYDELFDQREDFLNLAEDNEFKVPKAAKKVLEGGAIVTTGLLGGMATGWGTKKSIQGFAKLNKSEPMIAVKKHAKATKNFIKTSAKKLKKDFLESDAYKMPANAINKRYDKFARTKFGKPITKFFANVAEDLKSFKNAIKNGLEYLYKKITGIDKAKAEKVTVNTAGISGGIASGVTAIKEKQESGDEI